MAATPGIGTDVLIPKGVLYIVSGSAEIFSECIHSARSVKKFAPGIPIQLITTTAPENTPPGVFDFIDFIPEKMHPLKSKVRHLRSSRFALTLFLDADTEVRKNIDELFEGRHDFSFAHDNLCDWSKSPVMFLAQVSPDINTGLLLYRKCEPVWQLLEYWFEAFRLQDEDDLRPGHKCDQVYFNASVRDKILADKRLQVRILTNHIWNVRPWCWQSLKQRGLFVHAAIVHAHHLHYRLTDKIKRKVNLVLKKLTTRFV